MKGLKLVVSIILTLSLFAIGLYAQDLPADGPDIRATGSVERDAGSKGDIPAPASLTAISSTAPGGLWSASSTWVGGVVPGAGDDVTISAGSAVVIDTDVTVANLTVGPEVSFNAGVLTFDPSAARSLTVNGDLTVRLGILATPSTGTVTTHTITVGGNLTNNGVLDLSTNSNQAGAGLVFTNASNNTFGGDASQTNIRTITINKGTSNVNTLTLSVLNFTVQGSSTDTAASGYLTLTNGTFKISGTFTGNHRTFPTASYAIPATAGFWLNNPNYTVTAQTGDAVVSGALQITTGVYNVGTAATDALRVAPTGPGTGGSITVEGGSLDVSGAMRRGEYTNVSYRQTGGIVTTCIAGNFAPCFDLSSQGSGGKLVIQTPAAVPNDANPDFAGGFMWNTFLTFGNANTPGTGTFTVSTAGLFGFTEFSLAIDTTAGPHTVRISRGINAVHLNDVNIGPGGTLDMLDNDRIYCVGDSYINNGIFKTSPSVDFRIAFSTSGNPVGDAEFSGSGTFAGPVGYLSVDRRNMILASGFSGIRTRDVTVWAGTVINANRLTVGLNDNIPSTVTLRALGTFDSAPTFDLGTGGQKMVYYDIGGTQNTGPEINAARELAGLTILVQWDSTSPTLNIAGGDLTLNGPLQFTGVINTGSNRLRHLSGTITPGGFGNYVKGTVVRRFTAEGQGYTFPVGDFQYAPVRVTPTSLPSGPAEAAVTARSGILPGLDPSESVHVRWDLEQTGSMTSRIDLTYPSGSASGSESIYRAWRSSGGMPMIIATSTVSATTDTVTAQGLSNLTDSWGISECPPPISISGTVMAANGVGIRNAVVTITGGTLTAPVNYLTAPFGTYQFHGLAAGGEYTVFVSAKRNRFTSPSQIISSMTNITNVNFTANPQ
jgi:hypothetical protein